MSKACDNPNFTVVCRRCARCRCARSHQVGAGARLLRATLNSHGRSRHASDSDGSGTSSSKAHAAWRLVQAQTANIYRVLPRVRELIQEHTERGAHGELFVCKLPARTCSRLCSASCGASLTRRQFLFLFSIPLGECHVEQSDSLDAVFVLDRDAPVGSGGMFVLNFFLLFVFSFFSQVFLTRNTCCSTF